MSLASDIRRVTRDDPDAYVTAKSAMYVHGMVRAGPEWIEIATRRPTGWTSVNGQRFQLVNLPADLLGGHIPTVARDGAGYAVAGPEKALFDRVYGKRMGLPRLSMKFVLTPDFDPTVFDRWVQRVFEPEVRAWLERELRRLVASAAVGSLALPRARRVLPDSAESIIRLRHAGAPALSLDQSSAILGVPDDVTAAVMSKLSRAGLVVYLSPRLWAVQPPLDVYVLAPLLLADDAYVSLRSALHFHGLLHRRPDEIEVVSSQSANGMRQTKIGRLRVVRMDARLSGGYEEWLSPSGFSARVATPEKALIDLLVDDLGGWRSRRVLSWSTVVHMRPALATPWINRVREQDRSTVQIRFRSESKRAARETNTARKPSQVETRGYTLVSSGVAAPHLDEQPPSALRASPDAVPARPEIVAAGRVVRRPLGFDPDDWDDACHQVREFLISVARRSEAKPFVSLAELGKCVWAIPFSRAPGRKPGAVLLGLLRDVDGDEVAAGRPMLSALVNDDLHDPARGFARAARRLGRRGTDDEAMWIAEVKAVRDYWVDGGADRASNDESPDRRH